MKTAPLRFSNAHSGALVFTLRSGVSYLHGPVAEDNAPVRQGKSVQRRGRQSRLGGCRAGANPAGTTETFMGGRYCGCQQTGRLMRAAIYVVQSGNGATPTHSKEAEPSRDDLERRSPGTRKGAAL